MACAARNAITLSAQHPVSAKTRKLSHSINASRQTSNGIFQTSASLQTPFGSGTLIDSLGAMEGRIASIHKCERAWGEQSQGFGDVQHPQDVHQDWACGV